MKALITHIVAGWALLLAALSAPASAQDLDFPAPPQDSWILDQGEFLSDQEELALNQKLQDSFEATDRPIYIVTQQDLQGSTIENYGYQLGREWGVGDAERDDGVLLIVAREERRIRIETGYGARVFLPDIISGRIIRNQIEPAFKAGNFYAGFDAGTDAMLESLALTPEEAQARADELAAERSTSRDGAAKVAGGSVIMIVMIVLFVVLSIARSAGGRRYRGKGNKGKRRRRKGMDSGDLAVLLWGIDAATRI
ncbi:MAG: methanol dehydrogenase, partial [Sphingomonadaceae bacterium]